jgi:hypothetical protein
MPPEFDRRLEDYANRASANPFRFGMKVVALLVVGAVGISILGSTLGWFSEAATVARQEFGPRELLRKYELFKDYHAQLEKKQADISVFEARIAATSGTDRFAQQNKFQAQSELAGVIASYNTLAAQYNAGMAKFNYRFANVGMLPQGATEPLPREYAPYQSGGVF